MLISFWYVLFSAGLDPDEKENTEINNEHNPDQQPDTNTDTEENTNTDTESQGSSLPPPQYLTQLLMGVSLMIHD